MEMIRRLRRKVPEELFIADEQYVAERLRHLPALARQASERPDEYWEKQHSTIWRRISAGHAQSSEVSPRLVWTTSAAVVVLATMLLLGGSAPGPATQVQIQADPDHELLLAVERAVQIEGPQALEPAALLAQEIGRSDHNYSARKGNNHEN
jgi:hypothetical protein